MLPSPLGDGVGHSNHDRFRGYLSVHLRSGLQFPCLRFATAVTGRHARLGTRLLARPCRGCHFRRLCLTSFQGATPTDPDVRVLPHPAPRQTASLRAVAYPLVQEARRWPPPSPRLIWPVRLSVVVTWRRDPNLGVLAVFPSTGVARRADLVEQTLRRQTGELLETCLDDPGVGSQLVGHGWTWRVARTP